LFLPVKNNLAADTGGLAFAIDAGGRVAWEPDPVDVRADDVLGDASSSIDGGDAPAGKRGPEATARNEAGEWLAGLLAGGPLEVTRIRAEAELCGLTWGTVRRAKDALAVEAFRETPRGPWLWRLAAPADVDPQVRRFDPAPGNLRTWGETCAPGEGRAGDPEDSSKESSGKGEEEGRAVSGVGAPGAQVSPRCAGFSERGKPAHLFSNGVGLPDIG
jgi:hypothetical protein